MFNIFKSYASNGNTVNNDAVMCQFIKCYNPSAIQEFLTEFVKQVELEPSVKKIYSYKTIKILTNLTL
jgi:hypothetical protein